MDASESQQAMSMYASVNNKYWAELQEKEEGTTAHRVDVHHYYHRNDQPPPTWSGKVEKNTKGHNWEVTVNGARSLEEWTECLAKGVEHIRGLLGEEQS